MFFACFKKIISQSFAVTFASNMFYNMFSVLLHFFKKWAF